MRKFSAIVLCLVALAFVAPSNAAETKAAPSKAVAKTVAKPVAKATAQPVSEAETVDVEESVDVREMPANANSETIIRTVVRPDKVFGSNNSEKPSVKDKLPEFAKPGILGGLALGAIGLVIVEVLKFAALAFAAVWLIRHLFPNFALRADKSTAKLRKVTGVKTIGGVGDTVKNFDVAVAELRKKHAAHSGLASFMATRLDQFAAPTATTKKKVKPNGIVKTT